ncbi:MAG TPA: polysaccharide biosynthesis C-terminal domain-containing protein [Chryseosolibacter sp.]
MNQLVLHLLCYMLLIPGSLVLFFHSFIPWHYLGLFLVIVVLEHLSNELYRLLILYKKPLQSSVLMFLKSAFWVFCLPVTWLFFDLKFELVFYCWVIGLLAALVFGAYALRPQFKFKWTRKPVDIKWILQGVNKAIPFFASTLLLKVIEYSNRYFIDIFYGKETVGVFTFYSSFANVLSTVIFTLVIMLQYPQLLESFNSSDFANRALLQRKMLKDTVSLTLIATPVIVLCVGIFVSMYKNAAYAEDFPLFLILILANIFVCVNYATHYILYAQNKDARLLQSYLAGSAITFLLCVALVPQFGGYGAAVATLSGFVTLCTFQFYFIDSWQSESE